MNNLTIQNLCINFYNKPILKNINWQISAGKLTALVGPNGSGKTTLLKCLCNLMPVPAGCVKIGEKSLASIPNRDLAQTLAWVPQYSAAPFDFSCFAVVLLGRYPWHLGYPQKNDRERAMEALRALNMGAFADRSVFSLSSGERQRLYIARALACDTSIIVLDEPCANLDIAVSLHLLQHLQALTQQGKTIVITLHDLNLARRFADDAVILSRGRLVANGPAKTTIIPPLIADVFNICSDLSAEDYLILKNTKLPTMSPSIDTK